MKNLGRLLRTLWYVPPQAVLWRLWARLRRRYYTSPFYNLRALASPTAATPLHYPGIALIPGQEGRGAAIAAGRWLLAGQEFPLGAPPRSWLPKAQPLQVFELHYHEWLADLAAANKPALARQLLADWLLQFAHYHPIVWHPYPLSLRIVAWLTYGRWLLAEAEPDFKEAFEQALRAQLMHLRRNCEYDLGGNHLIKNLKALLLGGLALPDGALVLWAEDRLLRALAHQVLPDGAHDERSPHYHAQVLQDVLEVRAALRGSGAGGGGVWDTLAIRMGEALAFYTYPDGGLGLWNDGEVGDAVRVARLVQESGAGAAPSALPDAGYVRLAAAALGLVLDAGKVGPDENPGHAHADTLALEFWCGPQRVVVNSGTLAYQHPLRGFFRSTAAHATLELGGQSSAEVWAEHRVGRRPQQTGLAMIEDGQGVRAWHDGYRHLGVKHTRTLGLTAAGLTGTDALEGRGVGKARALVRFPLHPAVQVKPVGDDKALLTLPSGPTLLFTCEGGVLNLQPARYTPQFNTLQPTQQLVVRLRGKELRWSFMVHA